MGILSISTHMIVLSLFLCSNESVILNMPINVFVNSSSSNINGDKIDTSFFVQKTYLRSNYIESSLEEDIDLKNEY